MSLNRIGLYAFAASVFAGVCTASLQAQSLGPKVGAKAPDFRLPDQSGQPVQLSELIKQGPVVLVVLRGYPGYQCPACNAQTGKFFAAADQLRASGVKVVIVYPGQAARIADHAEEFLRDKTVPDGFYVVLDPDYALTNLYGLRWNAPRETAYPATFVVDEAGTIVFAKVSKSHGGRATVAEVLNALTKKSSPM